MVMMVFGGKPLYDSYLKKKPENIIDFDQIKSGLEFEAAFLYMAVDHSKGRLEQVVRPLL